MERVWRWLGAQTVKVARAGSAISVTIRGYLPDGLHQAVQHLRGVVTRSSSIRLTVENPAPARSGLHPGYPKL